MTPSSQNVNPPSKDNRLKAFILSGVIFPGAGQLSQGKKGLGLAIIGLSAAFLFIIIAQVFGEINAAANMMASSGRISLMDALEASQSIIQNLKNQGVLVPIGGLLGLWVFSMVETLRSLRT